MHCYGVHETSARTILLWGTSVEYPAMDVAHYCRSVVVLLSEMMARQ